MKRSTDRILTTHVGSLPRPAELLELLRRRELDEPHDPAAVDRAITEGVAATVRMQHEMGIDIVSDGEMSKMNYGTYVKDRLTGFAGEVDRTYPLDVGPYPEFRRRMGLFTGPQLHRRLSCVGLIAVKDTVALDADIANMKAAVAAIPVADGFVTAASPGVVPVFLMNKYYPTHQEYIEAVGAAMQHEYEAIADAGLILQLDCPDLAMGFHTGFNHVDEKEFLRRAAIQVEVLNHAVRNIPADRMRMHLCWGNYEGPHDFDLPLEKLIGIVLKAKPQAILFEAANPRHDHEWVVWKETRIPEDKILVPGTICPTTNYVEHPEFVAQHITRYADIVGRERVIAGTDCGMGTSAGFGKLDPDIGMKKLKSLVEGAEIASERLWH